MITTCAAILLRDGGGMEIIMFEAITEKLISLGYKVSAFENANDAVLYLNSSIDNTSVGFGGSVTLEEIGLFPCLSSHNEVFWHQKAVGQEEAAYLRRKASEADIYISSVNGIAETGEIINIDGRGNRVASIIYGHRKVYLIIGKNKIAKDYESALWRARNIAAPQNAKRLKRKTPCVISGHCHDCKSPDRICSSLCVLLSKPLNAEFEVILINEELGY